MFLQEIFMPHKIASSLGLTSARIIAPPTHIPGWWTAESALRLFSTFKVVSKPMSQVFC
jgi:hypothetical protein